MELVIAWMLLLLADDAVHGYKLHQGLHARGLAMQPSSMYRRLRRFEHDGWVASRWSEPIDGPRRHVYELTSAGRAALHEMSGSIAATRDTYMTFATAYEHARTRRADADGADDRTPAAGHAENDHGSPVAAAETNTPPWTTRLRPHSELLAGWLLLSLEIGAAHGYDLRRDVAEAHRLTTDPGTVYRMLRRFEANNWVRSRWAQSTGGPRRRVYELTLTGQRNLDQIAGLIASMREGLDGYLLAYRRRRDDGLLDAEGAATPA